MLPTYSLRRLLVLPAMLFLFVWFSPGCSKNGPGPNSNNNDSTDTVLHRNVYDSAKFHVTFDLHIANTNNVFDDSFSDNASMVVYIVNGAVKVPVDSIRNYPPVVRHQSGSAGDWSATWIPDKIGEINITAAAGVEIGGDTTVVMSLTQTGTVDPNWNLCFLGSCSPTGNTPSQGWPLAFAFNPKLQSQYPFKLDQQGSSWEIWVYKDY